MRCKDSDHGEIAIQVGTYGPANLSMGGVVLKKIIENCVEQEGLSNLRFGLFRTNNSARDINIICSP